MRKIHRAAASAIFFLWGATAPARPGDFEKIAAQLSRTAKARGLQRVAVVPFQSIGGKGSTSGRIVSERLVTPLTQDGGVEVVERAMLESVMREQQLQTSGLVDARSVKEIGKILNVDAVVTGTVVALKDERVEVNARLIDAETAEVLFAADAKIEQDWNESLFDDSSWAGLPFPSLPSFDLSVAASAAGWDCEHAQETVDDMERSLVDLKARFWAQKLREGLSGAALKMNPGSEIRNPEIRGDFYARLRLHSSAIGPALSGAEVAHLKDALERIKFLDHTCRGEGS